MPDREILRDHSAQARAEDMNGAGPDVIKDGEDIADHGLHAHGARGTAADAPVVHEHQPEPPAQVPNDRPPARRVEAKALDEQERRPRGER